jgi:hypothetical protein
VTHSLCLYSLLCYYVTMFVQNTAVDNPDDLTLAFCKICEGYTKLFRSVAQTSAAGKAAVAAKAKMSFDDAIYPFGHSPFGPGTGHDSGTGTGTGTGAGTGAGAGTDAKGAGAVPWLGELSRGDVSQCRVSETALLRVVSRLFVASRLLKASCALMVSYLVNYLITLLC